MSPRAYTSGAGLLTLATWQMTLGDRAALVGLLSDLEPALAIEIGTAEGGSLRQIAAHSAEVHSFDLVQPDPAVRALGNVRFHTGDGHALLPEVLGQFAEAGRNVDFVLVDGDHTAEGVARDMRDLIESGAIRHTLIVMHDTLNEVVRSGIERVDYQQWDKVRYVDLDFVPGRRFREPLLNELWGGLGLIIVDDGFGPDTRSPVQEQFFAVSDEMAAPAAEQTVPAEDAALRAQLAELGRRLDLMEKSNSWRITAPLRCAAARLRR